MSDSVVVTTTPSTPATIEGSIWPRPRLRGLRLPNPLPLPLVSPMITSCLTAERGGIALTRSYPNFTAC